MFAYRQLRLQWLIVMGENRDIQVESSHIIAIVQMPQLIKMLVLIRADVRLT